MRSAKADQVAGVAGRLAQQTAGETKMGLFAVVDKMTELQDENAWLRSALAELERAKDRTTIDRQAAEFLRNDLATVKSERDWAVAALEGAQFRVDQLMADLAEANGKIEQAYALLECRAESGRIRKAAKALDAVTLSKLLYEGLFE